MANSSIATLIFVVLLCISAAESARTKLKPINDQTSICKSMVESQGYVCQQHKVTTKDGYILGMQRIPVGRSGKAADKPPVLLQHGLFIDAVTWLFNSPNESLAFILADNGFDVWLANTRGTISSSGHKSLSPNDPDYWNWSWDELAAYDLPALVQYVHDQTGQKLHYVGHSLGTLMAFAAFSEHNLLSMIRSAGLLSPIAYLGQMPSQLARAAAEIFLAEDIYWLGLREFVPKGQQYSKLLEGICKVPGIDCSNLISAFTGPNCCVNASRINIFLDHEPQPTATKNLVHIAQMIRGGAIAMYDYGNEADNMKQYGQSTPPIYNMSNIPNELPLFLAYGGQDTLSDPNDVHTLLGSLKNHDGDKLVALFRDNYAHADFVMGVNANTVVYDPLISFFEQH
ncbi:hypothetical protein UlMin_014218 [Ulmus minor]